MTPNSKQEKNSYYRTMTHRYVSGKTESACFRQCALALFFVALLLPFCYMTPNSQQLLSVNPSSITEFGSISASVEKCPPVKDSRRAHDRDAVQSAGLINPTTAVFSTYATSWPGPSGAVQSDSSLALSQTSISNVSPGGKTPSETVLATAKPDVYICAKFCLNLCSMTTKQAPHILQLVIAVALVSLGSGLLVAGFCVSPVGEIHHSVLIAFGEIMTFAGSLIGIDYHYKYKSAKQHD